MLASEFDVSVGQKSATDQPNMRQNIKQSHFLRCQRPADRFVKCWCCCCCCWWNRQKFDRFHCGAKFRQRTTLRIHTQLPIAAAENPRRWIQFMFTLSTAAQSPTTLADLRTHVCTVLHCRQCTAHFDTLIHPAAGWWATFSELLWSSDVKTTNKSCVCPVKERKNSLIGTVLQVAVSLASSPSSTLSFSHSFSLTAAANQSGYNVKIWPALNNMCLGEKRASLE